MKKVLMFIALLFVVVALVACQKTTASETPTTKGGDKTTTQAVETTTKNGETTSSDDNYEPNSNYTKWMAAELDSKHTMTLFVQDKQSWWDNKASLYLSDDENHGFFAYNVECSEELYEELEEGTAIKITGYKAEWAGEIEFAAGATIEIVEDSYYYTAAAVDVTSYLGTDNMIKYQNSKVSFTNLEVVASTYKDENEQTHEAAWLYKWDGSGQEGDDLYFNVSNGTDTFTFTVESYLRGKDTDVYKAVKKLEVGDHIDLVGFAYWYNGLNPHIINVYPTLVGVTFSTYDEWMAAEVDTLHTVKVYVQAKQSWWENKASLYLVDEDENGYFAYNIVCSEEDYELLTEGREIYVTGYKAEWAGEIEFAEGSTFQFGRDENYCFGFTDYTDLLGTDEMITKQNCMVSFSGLTVVASTYKDENEQTHEAAWLYKWDGSGQEGDDLYFKVSNGTDTFTFTVESYLCGKDTDVYKAVKELKVGDCINVSCFAYWYNGLNPHVVFVETLDELYNEWLEAEEDELFIRTLYVQAKQSWWNDKATLYLADAQGHGYFAYNASCTEEQYAELTIGREVVVAGYKAVWAGEIEFAEGASLNLGSETISHVFEAVDATEYLGTNDMIKYQNMFVAFNELQVVASIYKDESGADQEAAWLYKWDGSGQEGDDLYFNVSDGENTYTFTVESYLCDKDSDVYKAVKALKIGDYIDVEGFAYWYNGLNPHITKVSVLK